MQVSTKLFNKQSVENFSDLTAQIQKKQEKVATGKHLTEPSDDPVKAGRVMVVKEQKAQTEQYLRNIDLSYVKLGLTDGALDEVQNLLTRAYELGVQGATATNANARPILATEMRGLLETIRDLSNATDASGRSIFGGFKIGDPPFTLKADGSTSYSGDRGVHTVTISPSLKLQKTKVSLERQTSERLVIFPIEIYLKICSIAWKNL